jgi:hypothetical protein
MAAAAPARRSTIASKGSTTPSSRTWEIWLKDTPCLERVDFPIWRGPKIATTGLFRSNHLTRLTCSGLAIVTMKNHNMTMIAATVLCHCTRTI